MFQTKYKRLYEELRGEVESMGFKIVPQTGVKLKKDGVFTVETNTKTYKAKKVKPTISNNTQHNRKLRAQKRYAKNTKNDIFICVTCNAKIPFNQKSIHTTTFPTHRPIVNLTRILNNTYKKTNSTISEKQIQNIIERNLTTPTSFNERGVL